MGLNASQKMERSEYLEMNLEITECSQEKPYVFISYASDNWDTVFKTVVVPMQKQYGLCVYADKAFDKVNDKWIVPMLRNIRGADVVIAFVSQSYIESYACFLEILTAVNNRKQIVFVSLEQQLHLGKTVDQPNVERGVKKEILNQGANIATNTNNTSNDIMRAMKSAFTSISTLLEQDALSKYDISDAFINFFRDAAINRKTINDLNAVKSTIESVSKNVFDKSLAGRPPKARPEFYEAPVSQAVPDMQPETAGQHARLSEEQSLTTNQPVVQTVPVELSEAQAVSTEQPRSKRNGRSGKIKALIAALAGVCVIALAGVIIGVKRPKKVTDMPYSAVNEDGDGIAGRYTGQWENNMPNGSGTIIYDTGTVYEGEFKNGIRNGQGTMTFSNGNVYEGEWKDDHEEGTCIYTYANGDVYKGEFKDGVRNGQGSCTYANGDVYEGEWKDDVRNGQGSCTYANRSVYEGEWKDDVKDGQGSCTYANGDVYEGEWKDDVKDGQGTYAWINGYVYEGEWKDDKMNGWGIMTDSDGDSYGGSWKDNKYMINDEG